MSWFPSLRPIQRQNEFVVKVTDPDWRDEWIEFISAQTRRVEFSLTSRTIVLYVNQLARGLTQEVIMHLLSKEERNRRIDSVTLSPSKGAEFRYAFKDGKLIDHGCCYDYDSSNAVVHKLTVEFKEVVLMPNNNGVFGILHVSD